MQLTELSGSWQRVCIANELKLKRTLSQKLDISGKAEQNKTHPFNFHEELKHSYRA